MPETIICIFLLYVALTVYCITFVNWMHVHTEDAKNHRMTYIDTYRIVFYIIGIIPVINAALSLYFYFKYIKC